MTFPSTQTFPTRISPNDRFEDLVAAAGVRLSNDRMLGGQDDLSRRFAVEKIAEPRVVPVRLLQATGYHECVNLDDVHALDRVMDWGFMPLSLHAFLAFLGQHRGVRTNGRDVTVLDVNILNGYACVYRYYDREPFKRDLCVFPVRGLDHGYSVGFLWTELYAVEPVRPDARAPVFHNPP